MKTFSPIKLDEPQNLSSPTPLAPALYPLPIVAALLLAAFLASHSMSRDLLWWDEHWSVEIAGAGVYSPLSLAQVWQNASADPWHPPAFYLILNVWNTLLGGSQFALRLFPFFTGMLALAWVYRFGAWAGGRMVGLGALCFLCGSVFFLDFMTELRPYMLYALFGIMCPALYWRLQNGKPNRLVPLLFAFSVLGLLYSHYFAALVAVALGGYHLLFARKNRLWWQTIGYAVGGAVLFIPWLVVFLTAVQIASGGERYNVLGNADAFLLLIRGLGNAKDDFLGFTAFFLYFAVGIVVSLRQSAGRFVVWSSVVILMLALAVNAWLAVLAHLRYVLVLWGFAALLVGWAISWSLRQTYGRFFIVGLVILWWGLAAHHLLFSLDFQNLMFRQDFVNIFRPHLPLYDALKTIEPELRHDDMLLLDSPIGDWAVAGAFHYYTGNWGIPRAMLTQLPGANEAELTQTLRDYTAQASRIWFAYETPPPDFHRAAFETLARETLTFCGAAFESPDLRLDEYSRYPSCCRPSGQRIAAYAAGVTLDHVEILTQDAVSLSLALGWIIGENVPSNTYSYGLYLLDAQNQVLAQADTGLPPYDFSCQAVTLALADIPPGEYNVYLTVYDWQTLARLSGMANDQTGEILPIITITIK